MKAYIRLWLAALITAVFAAPPAMAQTLFRPVAIVNESAITGFDIAQRAQLLSLMGGQGEEASRFSRQALEGLILDRLKIQAGEEIGLTPTDEIAKIGFNLFSEQNGRDADVFRRELNRAGVGDQAIDDFVTAETIWGEVIRARFLSRAEPSQTRINEELRHNLDLANTSYRLKEIGFRLTGDPGTDQQIRERINRVHAALLNGADFGRAVREHSETPSAARGGDLGWIEGAQLPIDMVQNLNSLEDGQITRPVATQNGIVILQLLERRKNRGFAEVQATEEEREQVRQNLLSEEISRLADGYLQEIRRDALIELQ